MNIHSVEAQLNEIRDFIEQQGINKKESMTLTQAAKYMGISTSYLYKLTSTRQISFSKPAAKLIFFKRSDLDDWMLGSKFSSLDELSIIPSQRRKGELHI